MPLDQGILMLLCMTMWASMVQVSAHLVIWDSSIDIWVPMQAVSNERLTQPASIIQEWGAIASNASKVFSSQPQTIDVIVFGQRTLHHPITTRPLFHLGHFISALYTPLAFPLPEILVGEIMFLTSSLRRQTMKNTQKRQDNGIDSDHRICPCDLFWNAVGC